MHGAPITAGSLCYQTSGSCALTPREVSHPSHLRLVEDAEVIVMPTVTRDHTRPHMPHDALDPQHDHAKLIRGAIAFFVGLAVLFAAMLCSDALAARAEAQALSGVSFEEVTVHAGDSLWTLASDHGVEGLTTAEVVSVIKRQNSLSAGLIHPGDTLAVPACPSSVAGTSYV